MHARLVAPPPVLALHLHVLVVEGEHAAEELRLSLGDGLHKVAPVGRDEKFLPTLRSRLLRADLAEPPLVDPPHRDAS